IFYMFFFGMVVDSLIIGVLAVAGLALLRVPYAAVLGVVIMVFNMIPYFGPFIGAVPAVLVALLGGGIYQAIWTALFILILQQFDGNLLKPKILGGSVGVSPFWVIFAIVVFGGLFGIWGMIFGVPVIAAIQLLARDYMAETRAYSEMIKAEETVQTKAE
ncbi:MAG: AI-2E family transporter, partial [Clostridia bacterium]|nr:AI-2E family transporter [Clostridia bacterium]